MHRVTLSTAGPERQEKRVWCVVMKEKSHWTLTAATVQICAVYELSALSESGQTSYALIVLTHLVVTQAGCYSLQPLTSQMTSSTTVPAETDQLQLLVTQLNYS